MTTCYSGGPGLCIGYSGLVNNVTIIYRLIQSYF